MADRMAEPEDRSPEWHGWVRRNAGRMDAREPASRIYWILLILFVELQIADILTTDRALAIPGSGNSIR